MHYMEASFRTTLNGAGELLYMLSSFVDVTDHREAETALRSSLQKLEETIEFMPDPTFIIDRNHRVIAWNRAIETLTGVKREEVLGKEDIQDAFSIYEGKRPVLVNLLDNAHKFSPTGSVIEISATADAEGLTLEVADHGYGPCPLERCARHRAVVAHRRRVPLALRQWPVRPSEDPRAAQGQQGRVVAPQT